MQTHSHGSSGSGSQGKDQSGGERPQSASKVENRLFKYGVAARHRLEEGDLPEARKLADWALKDLGLDQIDRVLQIEVLDLTRGLSAKARGPLCTVLRIKAEREFQEGDSRIAMHLAKMAALSYSADEPSWKLFSDLALGRVHTRQTVTVTPKLIDQALDIAERHTQYKFGLDIQEPERFSIPEKEAEFKGLFSAVRTVAKFAKKLSEVSETADTETIAVTERAFRYLEGFFQSANIPFRPIELMQAQELPIECNEKAFPGLIRCMGDVLKTMAPVYEFLGEPEGKEACLQLRQVLSQSF